MTMTPARSSPFAAMARDPLHPDVIYRDERCFVVRDINPKAPVHLLIIPNMPINGLDYISPAMEATMGHLFVVAAEMARREGVTISGYRLVVNNGEDAGQTIAWPHMHLLGGPPADGYGLIDDGRFHGRNPHREYHRGRYAPGDCSRGHRRDRVRFPCGPAGMAPYTGDGTVDGLRPGRWNHPAVSPRVRSHRNNGQVRRNFQQHLSGRFLAG